ncbi:MAG: trehalose-phosphatase [Omnitrophica WOR_2 bacterium RIFCSPHIGHO2_02_FULL_52_10]|nr:MAG: trehalose-phosphatase [Omnitrophica WOR_2 bacterium RIFCSPHIGHO2_02_FULL_52_10]
MKSPRRFALRNDKREIHRPSQYLFDAWNCLKQEIQLRDLLLFLDYDGTLTPIAATPAKAILDAETKKVLKKLSKISSCRLIVISGRALKDIKRMVGVNHITYVGNHGFEIEGLDKKFDGLIFLRFRYARNRIREKIRTQLIPSIPGVHLEDKGITLSLHYRGVNAKKETEVKTLFHEIIKPYLSQRKIKLSYGKKVLEIRPPIAWDKGKAVWWLLKKTQTAKKTKPVLPIYIGDDQTDEDAFKVLRGLGLTIRVGRHRSSRAEYYLNNPNDVVRFLKQILELKRKTPNAGAQ